MKPSMTVCNLCRRQYGGINLCQMNLSIESNLTTSYHTDRYYNSLAKKYHVPNYADHDELAISKFENRYSKILDEQDKEIKDNLKYDAKLKRYELTVGLLKRKITPLKRSISRRNLMKSEIKTISPIRRSSSKKVLEKNDENNKTI